MILRSLLPFARAGLSRTALPTATSSAPTVRLSRLPAQIRFQSNGQLFYGTDIYYNKCVFDLSPSADYTSMPDVALYLTYVARWLQKREIISGPATREETEYGRKYLESEMRNNRGIFAEPPTSRHQIIPSKYRPPPDSKRPTWSMIAEDKELQERIRDKDDDISLGYYINDECRLVREDQEEAFVKTNIRVPFPRIMKYPLSDEYLSKTVSLMYESKINPCWRCLESLDWDGDWEFYADWMEDVFMLHRFGQKVEVEKPAVIESSTMPPPPQLLPIKEYDHLIAPLGSA